MKASCSDFGTLALMLAVLSWASAPSLAQEHGEHDEVGEHHEGG